MAGYEGRLIVVTGAAGGIGRETAGLFAAGGARLLLVDPDEAGLAALRAELPAGAAEIAASDLADPAACAAVLGRVDGPIFALVHLAGIFVPEEAGPDPRSVYDRVMAANLTNAYDMAHAVIPRLDAHAITRIVLTSSLAFRRGSSHHLAYSAAKGGLVGLVRGLARRLAPAALVNGLAPGHIDTAMPTHLWADPQRAARMMADIPLRRRGHPREVATVIEFLCGPGSTYITGQIINVDGGIVSS